MRNIDFLCAECGNNIAKEVKEESVIQKCLGVLEEDGIYAFVIYSKSKDNSKDNKTSKILEKVEEFLKRENFIKESLTESDLYTDLSKLILVKEVIQKALIYARYHAKALGE